jgi:uncharacterized protein (UPF0212 family)
VSRSEQYWVTLSVPWLVRGAHAIQDAINIAVSEAGKRVSEADAPHVHHCDISIQTLSCTTCETPMEAVLVVAETALVGLTFECTVKARSPEDAEQTTRRELGTAFDGTPLVPVGTVRADSRSDAEWSPRDSSVMAGDCRLFRYKPP